MSIGGKDHFEEFKRDFFKKNHLIESNIIAKKKISDSEVTLTLQEVLEKYTSPETKYLLKSTTLVKYVRVNGEWKAKTYDSERIDYKAFKWIDGRYVPIETNKAEK